MEFPILSALAELGGAYARYCGRRLMRKLGGYEAAENRRVHRRAVVEKRAVADKRTVAAKRAVADKLDVAEKRAVADNQAAAAAVAGVPALGDIREIISEHWDVRHNALSNNLEAKPAGLGIGSAKFRQCGKNREFCARRVQRPTNLFDRTLPSRSQRCM